MTGPRLPRPLTDVQRLDFLPPREVLHMAAMSARLHDANIRAFYDRLLAAGKIHRVAIVACMRKLMVILNARIRDALRSVPHLSPTGA